VGQTRIVGMCHLPDWLVRHVARLADTAGMLDSMQPRSRRNWLVPALLGLIVVVLLAILAVLAWPHVAPSSAKPKASPRVVRNIAQPNPSCQDQPDLAFVRRWEVDGWWVGWLNGQSVGISGAAALDAQMQGAAVDRVWLCPPRSQW
jgi:hypothetical protein